MNTNQETKKKVVRVEVGFSESPEIQRTKSPVFNSMADANDFFGRLEYQAERDREDGKLMGYYKTDFTVTWEDGRQYKGRFDFGSDAHDLSLHIKSLARFLSGQACPTRLTPEQYRCVVARYNLQNFFTELLKDYEL